VRITQKLAVAITLASIALAPAALAQDEKGDPEAPPANAQGFGPRKNKPTQAQQGQAQQRPQAETVATHGKWAIQCTEAKAQDGSTAKSCGMIQQAKSDKNEKIGVSVIVRSVKAGDKASVWMQVMAPIGVYLPTGIPIEIDGNALPKPMIFNRCIPPICEATGEASADTLTRFRKGDAATFYIYDRPGNGFPIKISLEGFAAGLKALGEL
jgi:invasion protein IalB